MKNPVVVLSAMALVFSLSGCMKYQYVTISSNLKKNDNREHVSGNDSVTIRYSFNEINGPVKISIENRQGVPLYVSWTKSSLIVNGDAYTYFRDEAKLNASSNGYELRWTPPVSLTSSEINGTISRADQVSFIPPHASLKVNLLTLKQQMYTLSEPTLRGKIVTPEGSAATKSKLFERDNSVMQFRSYLTLGNNDAFTAPIVFDDQFWVSEIKETLVPPSKLPGGPKERSDVFFIRQGTGDGATAGVAGVTAAAVAQKD